MVATEDAKNVLRVLFTMVYSWFTSIETQMEFDYSYNWFRQRLLFSKKVLGEHTCIVVEKLTTNLVSKSKALFRHHFIGQTTLGFKGDSIVECSFGITKRSAITVDSRSHIDRTAMAIVEQNNEKNQRLKMDQCSFIDRIPTWVNCNVKNTLTKYALGIFCKNYDRRNEYLMYQSNNREWLVLHESNVSATKTSHSIPKFARVRKVTLDHDCFMNCSCGRTNEYLIPCEHICRVVGKQEFFGLQQFHIRWNKDFSYYFNTDYGKTISPNKVSLLGELFQETRQNHYTPYGLYRGCHMKTSKFMDTLKVGAEESVMDDKMKQYISHLYEKGKKQAVCKGDLTLDQFVSDASTVDETEQGSVSQVENFSIFTEEEVEINIEELEDNEPPFNAYNATQPLYEEALKTIRNAEDVDRLRKLLSGFIHDCISRNGTHTQDSGASFLNENILKTPSKQRRHKFLYEKF